MKEIYSWYRGCVEWLVPLGFQETFKNHPSLSRREFHWIKDGIRICCIFKDPLYNNYCYVQNDLLFMQFPFSLKGCQYAIPDPKVLEIHEFFKTIESILYVKKMEDILFKPLTHPQ